jgi:NitT/TauT family transport system substrate-binding protein
VRLVKAGDAEALTLSAGKLNVSKEETQEQLKGIKIFDLNENKTMALNASNPLNVFKNLELTLQTAIDMKLIEKPLPIEALYDDSLVKAL